MSIRQVVLFDQFSLLNIRIVFLSSAFVHLAVTAVVTLRIDTTVDEDPRIQAYHYIRWKLITFWFNVITLVYLPARLYADWLARRSGSNGSLVTSLNHATDVVMTSLLFPMTLYFDIVFWYIFTTDPALLAPTRVFEVYLPYWAQHSLHTVSIAVVLLDLVLTPRKRPESLRPRVALLLGFISIYSWMVYSSCLKGEIVYAMCESINLFQYTLLIGFSMASMLTLFAVQWVAIHFLWGIHQCCTDASVTREGNEKKNI